MISARPWRSTLPTRRKCRSVRRTEGTRPRWDAAWALRPRPNSRLRAGRSVGIFGGVFWGRLQIRVVVSWALTVWFMRYS